MPISTSPAGRSKIGLPAAGGVHEDRAIPNDRARALTRRAIVVTVARSSPRSALAPAIYSSRTVAPTPRRPAVYSESWTATSSSTSTDSTPMPSSAASSAASLKFITSPV